ncbi:hypothetical protein, partial [Falsigemmobacter intermedius]|uniref:hypothetical protein n=1 Tax=Falsigemmobacter intermedius TaxID=1553448 RepID=UPI0019D4D4B7
EWKTRALKGLLLPERFVQNQLMDLPTDDLAAENVEDQIEIEEAPRDRPWHPGDMPPRPDLARAGGLIAGRRAPVRVPGL